LASRRSLLIWFILLQMSVICAQQVLAQPRRQEIRFEIASQALADALVAYAKSTGLEILVDDTLVSGRRSAAVSGELHPTIALRRMLAETGLEIRYLDRGAVTLLPYRAPDRDADDGADRYASFSVALRAALLQVNCGYNGAHSTDYRVAAQLWIGPDGSIERSLLLGSTGDRGRDAEVLQRLDALRIGQAPPADLPQPATVIVAARSSQGCRPARRAGDAP
jgi:hypothetical protein